jgi:hypothetical protein
MARAASVFASVTTVITGVAALVGWLSEHVPGGLIIAGAWGAILPLRWLQEALGYHGRISRLEAAALFVPNALVGAVIAPPGEQLPPVAAFVVAASILSAMLIPLARYLYLQDKNSRKRCEDCDEEIRANARVCRYCGYRYGGAASADQLMLFE